jgi:phage terminase large subunit-like protein
VAIPRKAGKSTTAAGIALYFLTADQEMGAEVYSAAADRDQARIVFEQARQMVEATPPSGTA